MDAFTCACQPGNGGGDICWKKEGFGSKDDDVAKSVFHVKPLNELSQEYASIQKDFPESFQIQKVVAVNNAFMLDFFQTRKRLMEHFSTDGNANEVDSYHVTKGSIFNICQKVRVGCLFD